MTITTREKLKLEALTLFSDQGFAATTVGDVEKAAGLTPRAGGFYRHFPSKMAILDAIVKETEAKIFAEFESNLMLPLGDLRAELLMISRMILHIGEKYSPLRVLLRAEGRSLPDFRQKVIDINSRLHDEHLTPWVSANIEHTVFSGKPLDEMVQVIFGSIFYYMSSLDLSPTPYGLEQEKFLQCWADVWEINLARNNKAD